MHVLLARLLLSCIATKPFNLHVLGTSLAFILSQGQTLHLLLFSYCFRSFFSLPLNIPSLA